MEIKITGFGYTWVEGDHPLWLILSTVGCFILFNVAALRLYGRYHPEKAKEEDVPKED